MAYIKRRVQIYINWNEQEIMTQEEYERIKAERLDEKLQDDWDFREWLEGEYSIAEVFDMDETERDEVRERYTAWCEECVESLMRDDGYAVEETEVEVWVDTEPQQKLNNWKG
jgi:hypothetical protein